MVSVPSTKVVPPPGFPEGISAGALPLLSVPLSAGFSGGVEASPEGALPLLSVPLSAGFSGGVEASPDGGVALAPTSVFRSPFIAVILLPSILCTLAYTDSEVLVSSDISVDSMVSDDLEFVLFDLPLQATKVLETRVADRPSTNSFLCKYIFLIKNLLSF